MNLIFFLDDEREEKRICMCFFLFYFSFDYYCISFSYKLFCSSTFLSQENFLRLKECVERSPVAPFQQKWLEGMLARVSPQLRQGSGRQKLLEKICQEVEEKYHKVIIQHKGELVSGYFSKKILT